MPNVYIKKLKIEKVRHLKDISISLQNDDPESKGYRHLLLTGKNGSGKTSVLDAIALYFSRTFENNASKGETDQNVYEIEPVAEENENYRNCACRQMGRLLRYKEMLIPVALNFNLEIDELKHLFNEGKFILAFYEADRTFEVAIPDHIEKVVLKNSIIFEKNREKNLPNIFLTCASQNCYRKIMEIWKRQSRSVSGLKNFKSCSSVFLRMKP